MLMPSSHFIDSGWVPARLDSSKSLTRVSKSDANHYQCRAENGVGPAIEASFQIIVSGTNASPRAACRVGEVSRGSSSVSKENNMMMR